MTNERVASMSAELDRDIRTLTEFGFRDGRRSPKRSGISDGLDWIQQLFTAKAADEDARDTQSPSPPPSSSSQSADGEAHSAMTATSAAAAVAPIGKEYWMSDRNCRQCYDCQQPFSFFRRRHHCRLCGLVFCGACSHQQIDGKRYGVTAQLRVCKHCHTLARRAEQAAVTRQQNAAAALPPPSSASPQTAIVTRDAILPLAAIQFDEVKETNAKSKLSFFPSLIPSQEHNKRRPANLTPLRKDIAETTNRRSVDAAAPKSDVRVDESKTAADDAGDSLIRDEAAAAGCEESERYRSARESDSDDGDADELNALNIHADDSSSSSSNSDCEAEVDEDDINALIATNKSSLPTPTPPHDTILSDSGSTTLLPTDERSHVISSAASPLSPSSSMPPPTVRQANTDDPAVVSSASSVSASGYPSLKSLHERELEETLSEVRAMNAHHSRLERVAATHLRQCIMRLCRAAQLHDRWIQLIEHFAVTATRRLRTDPASGDAMDIRRYFKVKCISGGSIEQSAFVDGVVFRKNVAHKKMSNRIIQPRILLLSCALEYARDEKRLASMDTLLEQEQESITFQVRKIVALQPDLLVVEKTVNRLAQDLLRAAGITLILNVKPSLMHRISRCTMTPILPATDFVEGIALGSCGVFSVQTFDIDNATQQQTPAAVSDTCTSSESVDSSVRSARPNRIQLMFFEQCPPARHSTVCLRGGTQAELKRVKFVLSVSAHIAYNCYLESAILFDQCATYTDEDIQRLQRLYEQSGLDAMSPADDDRDSDIDAHRRTLNKKNAPPAIDTAFAAQAQQMSAAPSEAMSPPIIARENTADVTAIPLIGATQRRRRRECGTPISSSPFIHTTSMPVPTSVLTSYKALGFSVESDTTTWLHESILFSSSWLTASHQCYPPEVKLIDFYTENDKTLGAFLTQNCFDLKRRCLNENCGRDVIRHTLAYGHGDGRVVVTVKRIKRRMTQQNAPPRTSAQTTTTSPSTAVASPIPLSSSPQMMIPPLALPAVPSVQTSDTALRVIPPLRSRHHHPLDNPSSIMMWSRCKLCGRRVTPYMPMSDQSFNFSFGKFLDLAFYNQNAQCRTGQCTHSIHRHHIRLFGLNGLMAAFEYFPVKPYAILTHHKLLNTAAHTQTAQHYSNSVTSPTALSQPVISGIEQIRLFTALSYSVFHSFLNICSRLDANLDTQQHRDILRTVTQSVLDEQDAFTLYLNGKGLTLNERGDQIVSSHKQTKSESLSSSSPCSDIDIFELNGLHRRLYLNFVHWNSALGNAFAVFFPPANAAANVSGFKLWMNASNSPHIQTASAERRLSTSASGSVMSAASPRSASGFSPAASESAASALYHSPNTESDQLTVFAPNAVLVSDDERDGRIVDIDVRSAVDADGVVVVSVIISLVVSRVDGSTSPAPLTLKTDSLRFPSAEPTFTADAVSPPNDDARATVTALSTSPVMSPVALAIERSPIPLSVSTSAPTSSPTLAVSPIMLTSPIAIPPHSQSLASSRTSSSDFSSASQPPQVTPETLLAFNPRLPQETVDFLRGHGHMKLPPLALGLCIPVYEDEPSSLIAYSLASLDHLHVVHRVSHEDLTKLHNINAKLSDHTSALTLNSSTQTSSLLSRHYTSSPSADNLHRIYRSGTDSDNSGVDEFAQSPPAVAADTAIPAHLSINSLFGVETERDTPKSIEAAITSDDAAPWRHSFEDSDKSTTFLCTTFFPRQFHALRLHVCRGDYSYLSSLSRCLKWSSNGGKSGSTFSKTADDRFVLKYIRKTEIRMFIDTAQQYFAFIAQSAFHNLPSLILPIIGVYQISWKKTARNERLQSQYVLVMPNLFYNRIITRVFDLKGSARNRYVKRNKNSANDDTRRVLLDENLLEYTNGHPIPLNETDKSLLRMALFNDSLFLSSLQVVDYSLLVGLNERDSVQYCGIIDYIRQYTWDKRLETAVKSTGIIAGQAAPTVISPNSYKQRFRLAMERYFAAVPNQTSERSNVTANVQQSSPLSAHHDAANTLASQ